MNGRWTGSNSQRKENDYGCISGWMWSVCYLCRNAERKKNKNLWQNKTECTDEAINAVRDYMVNKLLGGFDCEKAISSGYEWTLKDGRVVELRVTIKQPAE